jgi:hypothetical protein
MADVKAGSGKRLNDSVILSHTSLTIIHWIHLLLRIYSTAKFYQLARQLSLAVNSSFSIPTAGRRHRNCAQGHFREHPECPG